MLILSLSEITTSCCLSFDSALLVSDVFAVSMFDVMLSSKLGTDLRTNSMSMSLQSPSSWVAVSLKICRAFAWESLIS